MTEKRAYAAGYVGGWIPQDLDRRLRKKATENKRTITEQLITAIDYYLTNMEINSIPECSKGSENAKN